MMEWVFRSYEIEGPDDWAVSIQDKGDGPQFDFSPTGVAIFRRLSEQVRLRISERIHWWLLAGVAASRMTSLLDGEGRFMISSSGVCADLIVDELRKWIRPSEIPAPLRPFIDAADRRWPSAHSVVDCPSCELRYDSHLYRDESDVFCPQCNPHRAMMLEAKRTAGGDVVLMHKPGRDFLIFASIHDIEAWNDVGFTAADCSLSSHRLHKAVRIMEQPDGRQVIAHSDEVFSRIKQGWPPASRYAATMYCASSLDMPMQVTANLGHS